MTSAPTTSAATPTRHQETGPHPPARSLELDSPQITEELSRADGAAYATAVILHELGHVMGLEHVDDPGQLMYPEIGAPDGLAAGDLNGLQALGGAPCRKDL
jgi:hypothetical protein